MERCLQSHLSLKLQDLVGELTAGTQITECCWHAKSSDSQITPWKQDSPKAALLQGFGETVTVFTQLQQVLRLLS